MLASYGHVRDLPENPGKGKLGVDVEHDFAPEYVVNEDRRKQVNAIAQGGAASRLRLPRDRPRPRGRVDRVARRRGRRHPRGQDPSGDVQRDHAQRDHRGVPQPARHRHEPRRRAADAPHRRPHRRLHAEPARQPQGPLGPLGRSRAVGRGPARRRARARDRGLRRARVLDDRRAPVDRCRRPVPRPRSSGSTARPIAQGGEVGRNEVPIPDEADRHRVRRGAARPGRSHHVREGAPDEARRRRRRSRRARSSRRRAASSRSGRSGRCRSRSGSTRASRSTASRSGSSRTCGPTRSRSRVRDGRGARRREGALRGRVRAPRRSRLQDADEGRPGGARGHPADELRARPRLARGDPEVRRAAPLSAHLAAGARLPDGREADGDDERRGRRGPLRPARERHPDDVRRLLARLHRGPRRRRGRRCRVAPPGARRGRRRDRRPTPSRRSTSPSRRRATPRRRSSRRSRSTASAAPRRTPRRSPRSRTAAT